MGIKMMETIEYCDVTHIKPMGEGLRVCIDFVDALAPTEGVFVGDTGYGYLLSLSESVPTTTYPARPFRVNAGAFHQYLLLEEGKTCYLSELKAGDKIPVYSREGMRVISVGRVKIERRELLQVQCTCGNQVLSSTVQFSDSVRFFGKENMVDAKTVEVGDKLVCRHDIPGRHLGKRKEEYIEEI